MKIRFLLIGTSLSFIPQTINAQCVATQDCATLGYTETSCSGGSGVKCPFGNKWACFKSDSEVCQQYGFTLSCTGTNQTGGASKACNGKYNICKCATNFTWNTDTKSCEANTANCVIPPTALSVRCITVTALALINSKALKPCLVWLFMKNQPARMAGL